VFINGQDLVIRYWRSGTPHKLPTGCRCMEACDNGVSCVCPWAGSPSGIRYSVQREMPNDSNNWVFTGSSDISFVTGGALGAKTGETVNFRVCATDEWGTGCTPTVTFTYREIGQCPVGSGGGGTGGPPRCVRGPFGVLNCTPRLQ